MRALLVCACVCVLMFAGTMSASADVTVVGANAVRGGDAAIITLRVPDGSEKLSTTSVSVKLPTSTPLIAVQMIAIAGWGATQQTITLPKPVVTDTGSITEAVSEMTWTAGSGNGLQPGSFGEFAFNPGPLPDTASLTFVITQTYSDHSVVRWDQPVRKGQAAADYRPAAVLTLGAKAAPAPVSTDTGGNSTLLPLALAVAAMVLAVVAVGIVMTRRVRGRVSLR